MGIVRNLAALARHAVVLTTAWNFLGLAAVTVSGILLARGLGETGRGHYAGIVAWYGVGLTLGELGQSAALTYFTARHPESVRRNVRVARRIMAVPSAAVFLIGVAMAPVLSGENAEAALAYSVAFVGILLNGFMAPYLYSFQAFRLSTWNALRTVQPVTNLLAVALLAWSGQMSLVAAVACLLLSTALQLALGTTTFLRTHRGSSISHAPSDSLLGFGVKQAGSAVPSILTHNLDRLYLSQTVAAEQLGQYAVAQSVLSIASPVGSAIASVAFPAFAARSQASGRTRAEVRVVLRTVAGVGPLVLLLAVVSPWLVPVVFGAEYAVAGKLSIWIAPAVLAQSVLTVMSALLRGRGRPGYASVAQTIALVGASAGMMVAVPQIGVVGAAVGSLLGSLMGIAVMTVMLFGPKFRRAE